MKKYIVTEIQNWIDGSTSTQTWAYKDEDFDGDDSRTLNAAKGKYYDILAAASRSNLPVHAALMCTEEGFPVMHECIKKTVQAE